MVTNHGYRLVIDSEKGTIASLRSTFGLDHDLLIPAHTRLPLFKVEFVNDQAEFKTASPPPCGLSIDGVRVPADARTLI
jgi:hypothetical protein